MPLSPPNTSALAPLARVNFQSCLDRLNDVHHKEVRQLQTEIARLSSSCAAETCIARSVGTHVADHGQSGVQQGSKETGSVVPKRSRKSVAARAMRLAAASNAAASPVVAEEAPRAPDSDSRGSSEEAASTTPAEADRTPVEAATPTQRHSNVAVHFAPDTTRQSLGGQVSTGASPLQPLAPASYPVRNGGDLDCGPCEDDGRFDSAVEIDSVDAEAANAGYTGVTLRSSTCLGRTDTSSVAPAGTSSYQLGGSTRGASSSDSSSSGDSDNGVSAWAGGGRQVSQRKTVYSEGSPERDMLAEATEASAFHLREDWVIPDHILERVLTRLEETHQLPSPSASSPPNVLMRQKAQQFRTQSRNSLTGLPNTSAMFHLRLASFVRCEKLLLHPQSLRRLIWDIFCIIFFMYDLVWICLQVFEPTEDLFNTSMRWLVCIFWTLDILMSFLTCTYIDCVLQTSPVRIAKQYMSSWFAPDIIVTSGEWIMLSLVVKNPIQETRAIRFFRVLRFLRLIRLWKLQQGMANMVDWINSNSALLYFEFARIVTAIVLINHLLACGWFFIGESQGDDGWTRYHFEESGEDWQFKYATSYYWSITQFQGSSNIYPNTTMERFISSVVLLFALITFSSFVSSVTSIIIELHKLQDEKNFQNHVVRNFLRENCISAPLAVQVKKYVVWRQRGAQKPESEVTALQILPKYLLQDLHEEMRAPVLTGHQFFCEFRSDFSRVVRNICHEALSPSLLSPNEPIFYTGDPCNRMYFVRGGHCQYNVGLINYKGIRARVNNSELLSDDAFDDDVEDFPTRRSGVGSVRGGSNARRVGVVSNEANGPGLGYEDVSERQWVSEAVLWTRWEHHGNFRAVTSARILSLDHERFTRIVRHSPTAHAVSVSYARRFIGYINSLPWISDLIEEAPDIV